MNQSQEKSSAIVSKCRLCRVPITALPNISVNSNGQGVLGFLGDAPAAFPSSVEIFECPGCGFVQHFGLPVHYPGDTSVSANSKALMGFRKEQYTRFVNESALVGKDVLEVGCGDGHGLHILKSLEARPFGVDSSEAGIAQCHAEGLHAKNVLLAADSDLEEGPFAAAVALHVLEHIPDFGSFFAGIRKHLSAGAHLLIEVPSLEQLDEQSRFIEFFPDHLNYFSARTLRVVLELHGFEVLTVERTWYGEHLTATARLADPSVNWGAMRNARSDMESSFREWLGDGERPNVIWGASAQAVTMLNELEAHLVAKLSAVIDSAPLKQNRRIAGTALTVAPPSGEYLSGVGKVLITATRFEAEISEQLRAMPEFQGNIFLLRENRIVPENPD